MKKIFHILLLPAILFLSCSKEVDENYHVSFTVNGVAKTYTAHTFAHLQAVGGGNSELTILGAGSSTSFGDYLGIYINNSPGNGAIQAGQYQDNSASYTVLTTYENAGSAYEAGHTVAEQGVIYSIPIANHFRATITELTANGVARGTFSGDYYKDGDVHSTKISITNGTFYVKFQ